MHAVESFYKRYAGLLLFFAFFCSVVLYFKTPPRSLLRTLLRDAHRPVFAHFVFFLSAVLVCTGCALLVREYRAIPVWRRWLAFAGALALSFSVFEVGVIFFAKAGFTHGLLSMYWFPIEFAIKVIAILGTFFGSGWSRIAFVLALALACLVW